MSKRGDKRAWRERHDEAHELLMRRLEEGGPEYAIELAREAGILDEQGELTEPYKRLLREDEAAEREAS